ncbi:MAG: AraC family transcriptional regulator [Lachnospiraceae bacterium]|nr:AraC family transcriptional regulator [Lachnospiraceae bacterium]
MDLSKEWVRSEFINHEMLNRHREINSELSFYDAIASGNLEVVEENCKAKMFVNPDGVGRLSSDDLRNIKYHFVVTTALIVRYCIHYGMELEKAYSLSDFYIYQMDGMKTIEEVCAIHDVMCIDLCKKMRDLRKNQVLSKHIVKCVDYIYAHLHYRITIEELADYLELSVSYLSKLFKKEMGMALSDYINMLKIDKAKEMLLYTDEKIIDIANSLSFSSQSHFIKVFSTFTGVTPFVFRQKKFRSNWNPIVENGKNSTIIGE